jgi:hypothetical protein
VGCPEFFFQIHSISIYASSVHRSGVSRRGGIQERKLRFYKFDDWDLNIIWNLVLVICNFGGSYRPGL